MCCVCMDVMVCVVSVWMLYCVLYLYGCDGVCFVCMDVMVCVVSVWM